MKRVVKITAVLFVLIAVFLGLRYSDINFDNLTPQKVKSYLLSFGTVNAAIIYVMIYTFSLRPFIPVPPTVYTVAGGFTFGPVLGTVLTVTGATLNASISFILARWLGKEFVKNLFSKRLESINERLKNSDFKTILLVRSSPVGPPFDLVSYGCGLLNISFRNHFFATLTGIVPAVAVYSYFGGSITRGGFYILAGFFLIVVFSVLIPWLVKKRRKSLNNPGIPPPA